MSVIDVADKIQQKIDELDKYRNQLEGASLARAQAESDYDRIIAKTTIELKNGKSKTLDGEEIKSPPVTIIKDVVKGLCWKEKLEADTKDALVRNLTRQIEIVSSQLTAYQTLNKYLDKI